MSKHIETLRLEKKKIIWLPDPQHQNEQAKLCTVGK